MKHQNKKISDRVVPPKPLRPHNGYHLFFRLERYSILAEKNHVYLAEGDEIDQNAHLRPEKYRGIALPKDWFVKEQKKKRKDHVIHGVISFVELSKEMSRRWQEADDETKRYCNELAKSQLKIYYQKMKDYKEKYGKTIPDEKNKKSVKRKEINANDKSSCRNQNSPKSSQKATSVLTIPSIDKEFNNAGNAGWTDFFQFDSSINDTTETETTLCNENNSSSKRPTSPLVHSMRQEEGAVLSTNDVGYITASEGATTVSSNHNQSQDLLADLEPTPITSDRSKIKVVSPMESSQMEFPVDGEAQRFLAGLFNCNRQSQTNQNINRFGLDPGFNALSTSNLVSTGSESRGNEYQFHFPSQPQQQQLSHQQNFTQNELVHQYHSAPVEVPESRHGNNTSTMFNDVHHWHQYGNQTTEYEW